MSDVENTEVENEENPLAGLVQAALDKDYNKANEIFGDAISVKLSDIMDQERVKIAGQMFNGDPEDEDPEDEEDESDSEGEGDDEEEEDGSDEEEDENSSE